MPVIAPLHRVRTLARHRAIVRTLLVLVCLLSGSATAVASTPAAPVVRSLSITAGPTAGGQRVTLLGRNFTHGTVVEFGSARAHRVHVVSPGRLTAVTPPHVAGRVHVVVVTSAGRSATRWATSFVFGTPAAITGLSVGSGDHRGGTRVTIHGYGLQKISRVTFGAASARSVRQLSSTRVVVTTPPHAAGQVDIRLWNGYGRSALAEADRFTYVGPVSTLGWSAPQTVSFPGGELTAAACATTTACTATDSSGNAFTYGGAGWSHARRTGLLQSNNRSAISDVSCATDGFCVAVSPGGSAVTRASVDAPWSSATQVTQALAQVSCASAHFCAALGGGQIWLDRDGTWSGPATTPLDGVTSVSCPDATFCLAVDGAGQVSFFDGTVWGAATTIGAGERLISVSCPTATFCATIAHESDAGQTAYTWSGGAWSADAIGPGQPAFAVSCTAEPLCFAIAGTGVAAMYRNGAWDPPGSGHGLAHVNAVDLGCSPGGSCVIAGMGDAAAVYTTGKGSTEYSVDRRRGYLTNVSCAAVGTCTAVDLDGNAFHSVRGVWSTTPEPIGTSGVRGVSCPTVSSCVSVSPESGLATYDGTRWTRRGLPDGRPDRVSCASTRFCMTVGPGVSASFDGRSIHDLGRLLAFIRHPDVSCPTDGVCVAVDGSGLTARFEHGAWQPATRLAPADPDHDVLASVACVTTVWCAAVGRRGAYVYSHGRWSAVARVDVGHHLVAVDCPAAGSCAAVDNAGQGFTLTAGTWSRPALASPSRQAPTAISCGDASHCVATLWATVVTATAHR